jgi:hypothetical protein
VSWLVARGLGWETTGRAVVTTAAGVGAGGALYLAGMVALRVPELATLRTLVPGRPRSRM